MHNYQINGAALDTCFMALPVIKHQSMSDTQFYQVYNSFQHIC